MAKKEPSKIRLFLLTSMRVIWIITFHVQKYMDETPKIT